MGVSKRNDKSFVLEFETGLSKKEKDICEKKLRIGRQMYNAFLSECLRRIESYKSDLSFIETAKEYKSVKETGNSERIKELSNKLNHIKKSHNWGGEFCLADFRKKQYSHFSGALAASVVCTISFRAYRTAIKLEKGEIRRVHFVNDEEDFSIEGNTNSSGIYLRNNAIFFNRDTHISIKKKDGTPKEYYEEALKNRIKYCRLLSRTIRGKKRYYIQLILEGTPPNHRKYGEGIIKINDVGLSNVDLTIDGVNRVIPLIPEHLIDEEKGENLQLKMDRSRRATNPDNYADSGAPIKGKNNWRYSNNYIKLNQRYKELRRKEAAARYKSHGRLTNELIAIGSNISIDRQSYKAFVEMNKNNLSHGATKKQNKAITKNAPADFVIQLERKLGYVDKELVKNPKMKKVPERQKDQDDRTS